MTNRRFNHVVKETGLAMTFASIGGMLVGVKFNVPSEFLIAMLIIGIGGFGLYYSSRMNK